MKLLINKLLGDSSLWKLMWYNSDGSLLFRCCWTWKIYVIVSLCFKLFCLLNSMFSLIVRSSRPVVFHKINVLKNFAKILGKHLCQRLFFNKVAGWNLAKNNKKNRLWHRCFPVNFAKFLSTPAFTEHLQWLLLTT